MSNGQAKATDPNAKLGFIERLAYGCGDYGGNLIYSTISSFLLVYYISVIGVNASVAASVMAISKIFDGVSDLVMGRIVDNTNTKMGKARPWLLRMSIPMGVCAVLMFTVPASWGGGAQAAYMFISYNLVSTVFYTGYNVPYATLQGLMTLNQYERGLLGNFRMLLATAGTMTVNTLVPILTAFFGGGEMYTQKAWTISLAILAAAFIAISAFTTFACKERVVQNTGTGEEKGPSVMECLKSLVKNKYWILVVIYLFVLYFMMSTFFGSNMYYAQYVLGDAGSFSLISNVLSIAQIGMMFITPFLMRKISKRWISFMCMGIAAIAFLFTFISGSNITLVVISNLLKGAAFGFGAATMFGMLQDSITYGQWLTGVPAMGMGNAASSFGMKVGSGVGTAALGVILDMGGFDGTAATQSASGIAAINTACIWVPIITCVIGGVCMLLFDLDKHYDRAVSDLENGRWKGSN
ncbi:MAG: MFS transporter [Lachnospiraceae bacterium]|nr:MFS transporter [Lachnospiraceae bacterium]